MKTKSCVLLITMSLMSQCAWSQAISPFVNGQNLNLTDTVGVLTNAGGKFQDFHRKTGPKSDSNFVAFSHVVAMRYGGELLEVNAPLDGLPNNPNDNISKMIKDYISKAIQMYDNNIEPLMTLPMNKNHDDRALPNDTMFTTIGVNLRASSYCYS